jgi:hypothetical protein
MTHMGSGVQPGAETVLWQFEAVILSKPICRSYFNMSFDMPWLFDVAWKQMTLSFSVCFVQIICYPFIEHVPHLWFWELGLYETWVRNEVRFSMGTRGLRDQEYLSVHYFLVSTAVLDWPFPVFSLQHPTQNSPWPSHQNLSVLLHPGLFYWLRFSFSIQCL